MPSDDDFSDSDDELFDYRQPYYGYEDSEGEHTVQDDTDADIEDLTNRLSRLTVSSLSSSSSSLSLDSESLLDQIVLVTRQTADALTPEYNVSENFIDRILDLHPRNTTPRDPWFDESSDSEQPISVWINAMPRGRGSQRVCPVVAFFIIVLMVLSHSQFPFPQ